MGARACGVDVGVVEGCGSSRRRKFAVTGFSGSPGELMTTSNDGDEHATGRLGGHKVREVEV